MTYCHHKRHIERKNADSTEKKQTMEYHNEILVLLLVYSNRIEELSIQKTGQSGSSNGTLSKKIYFRGDIALYIEGIVSMASISNATFLLDDLF